ncbi:MAG: thiamine pyrophosphate-binding protein [Actinomycetia bacterium]|nr:thiamine pyrophosphate-binding protein [Actinomycetes bacterium]
MKGHDAIAQALVDQGVATVFGVLGDANLFIGEALTRIHDVHYVPATHEASAVCMALGYSRASGRLGVATCTHGPGLTNTVTALVDGAKARTPMLLVTGDTPTEAEHHLQNIDQADLIRTTGAGFVPVRSPRTIAADVATAVRRAHAEQRPIALNVPLEFEWEEVDYQPAPAVAALDRGVAADPAALDAAVGLIASSSRPLIMAGRGAVVADAHDALVRLGEILGAPLCTSLLGVSYFGDDDFDLGIHGTVATSIGGEAMMTADCIVAFGAHLSRHTTDDGALLNGKRVVQVDIDPGRIGATAPVDVGVVGDARRVAETMAAMLEEAGHQPSSYRSADLASRLEAWSRVDEIDDRSTDTHVDPRTALARLDEIIPDDRTVTVDAGRFMLNALIMPVPEPAALVTSHAFGSIGLGMGTAIGAAVAVPDRPNVLFVGDGGFMMGGLNELHTAVHHELDIIVVLYNDGSYGAEHIQLVRKNMDPAASLHHWPDFTAVAAALGCDAVAVRNLDDFEAAAKAVAQRQPGHPVFIEIAIDPDVASALQP